MPWDILASWCDLMSGGFHEGHPRTVLGHPCKLGWLDVRRIPWGTSQDCPGTSLLAGVIWCPEDPMSYIPGQSWLRWLNVHRIPTGTFSGQSCDTLHTKVTWHPEDSKRDVWGQSWDILVSWERISWRTSQDCPETSLQASPVVVNSKKKKKSFFQV